MKEFIIYLLKTGICLTVFQIIYQLFLRRATFFKFNRLFLLVGLVSSFFIPLIPYHPIVEIAPMQQSLVFENHQVIQSAAESINYWDYVFVVYLMVVTIFILRSLIIAKKFSKYVRHYEADIKDKYKLIDNRQFKNPFSVFDYIFIDLSSLSGTEKDVIIEHEKTHIYQKHWIDLLLAKACCILQWFNPLVWFYMHLIKENHEFLADNSVLKTGTPVSVYQAVLINQAFQSPVFTFSNSFNYSNKLNRLAMIKKQKSSQARKLAVLGTIPVFGLFLWAFSTPEYVVKDEPVKTIKINVQMNDSLKSDLTNNELYIVDGETVKTIDNLDAKKIRSVSVLKGDSAIAEYGEKGKNGVVVINIKNDGEGQSIVTAGKVISVSQLNGDKSVTIVSSTKTDGENPEKVEVKTTGKPLILIDGVEIPQDQLKNISPDVISSISVLKDKSAVEKFGEKGVNGVIEITTKK